MTSSNNMTSILKNFISSNEFLPMPCCFDALSAKLIEQAGFKLTFMSGFAASASRLGAPDLGLMSYGEVVDQARNINEAISIPMIVDGDTGYGNAMNVKRTVSGLARAGCAAILIEDQIAPKRCGHTPGKDVVSRQEAFDRIQAAVDAKIFHEIGADILFVEAPKNRDEMKLICSEVPGCKMANIVEGGLTPNLSMKELADLGYQIAAYPLTLLSASMLAMKSTLELMKEDLPRDDLLLDFGELRKNIGFDEYYSTSEKYTSAKRS